MQDGYNPGLAMIFNREVARSLLGCSPVSERIIMARLRTHPHDVSIVQFYSPTSNSDDEQIEAF